MSPFSTQEVLDVVPVLGKVIVLDILKWDTSPPIYSMIDIDYRSMNPSSGFAVRRPDLLAISALVLLPEHVPSPATGT